MRQRIASYLKLLGHPNTFFDTVAPEGVTYGVLKLITYMDLASLNPGVVRTIISQYGTGAGKRSFHFSVDGSGNAQSAISVDGAASLPTINTTVPLPATSLWMMYERDPDGTINVWTSLNDIDTDEYLVVWSLLQTRADAGGAPYSGSLTRLQIGNKGGNLTPFNGVLRFVKLMSNSKVIAKLDLRKPFDGIDDVGNIWVPNGVGYKWITPLASVMPSTTPPAPSSLDPLGVGFATNVWPAGLRHEDGAFANASSARYFNNIGAQVTATTIFFFVTTSSGNISVGAYTATGTGRSKTPGAQLVTSGAIACPAGSSDASVAVSSFTINHGDWLAISCDNVTATFTRADGAPGSSNLGQGNNMKQLTAHPIPTSPSSLTGIRGGTIVMGAA